MDISKITDFAEEDDRIMALYLIGSYGTPYQTPLSDIDFAVLAKEPLDFRQQAQLLGEFMSILETDDVDIVFLHGAGPHMQHKVLSEGRLLYNRDEAFLADFIEKTIKIYCDFQIDLNQFYRDYDAGLREAFGHDRTR